ncbi:MAG: YdcF family protein, partial [Bryobacteraceae bacterium]
PTRPVQCFDQNTARMKRFVFRAAILAFALVAATLVYYSFEIGRQSGRDEARPADVILVLGAAEYRGRPSPVLKARLDHAFELYKKRLAPRILTTGGAGGDPDFTEGGVGRSYLVERGVPAEAIIVEPEGESTAHSTAAAGEIMERMGLKSCILVSDGYHIYRAKKMLEARGLKVYGSPRPSAERNALEQTWLYFRQACGYVLWTFGLQK